MAHREDISVKDLAELQRLFFKIGLQRKVDMNPSKAFQVGESCLALLTDVVDDAVELAPQLAKWQRFGPCYSKEPDNDGTLWHYLGFYFHRDSWRQALGAGISLSRNRAANCCGRVEVGATLRFTTGWADDLSKICNGDGCWIEEKMLKSFLSAAKRHGIKCLKQSPRQR